MKLIDLDSWNRKEHFLFFSSFANPTLGLVTEVDCTHAYEKAKTSNYSFFAYYMHKSMTAVNRVKAFKYRIIDNQVFELDLIHAGSTIGRKDGTFGFAYIPFSEDFKTFDLSLKKEIELVEGSAGLRLNSDDQKYDLIRHTTIPWITFTGLLHPTKLDKTDSVPKISFGKANERNGKRFLPISIEAHHGLVDGHHIAMYLEEFQKLLNAD